MLLFASILFSAFSLPTYANSPPKLCEGSSSINLYVQRASNQIISPHLMTTCNITYY